MEPNGSMGGLIPEHIQNKEMAMYVQEHLKSVGKWASPNTIKQQEERRKEMLRDPKYKPFVKGAFVLLEYPNEMVVKRGFQLNVSTSCLMAVKSYNRHASVHICCKIYIFLFQWQLRASVSPQTGIST